MAVTLADEFAAAVERLTDDDEQGGHRDPGRHLAEHLGVFEALAESFPSEVLTAVRLITQPTDETWEILAGRDNIKSILAIGLSQQRTRGEAESLAHELGARGYTEFREVLEQN